MAHVHKNRSIYLSGQSYEHYLFQTRAKYITQQFAVSIREISLQFTIQNFQERNIEIRCEEESPHVVKCCIDV